MSKFIIVLAAVLVSACSPSPQQSAQVNHSKVMETKDSDRVQVYRLSVIDDGLAYDSKRATYLIVDSETGKEFIGVSGIGIVETGLHGCGKGCWREDER